MSNIRIFTVKTYFLCRYHTATSWETCDCIQTEAEQILRVSCLNLHKSVAGNLLNSAYRKILSVFYILVPVVFQNCFWILHNSVYTLWICDDPIYKLCGQKGMMAHILSWCKAVFAKGRYRWRHDKVLTVLADILKQERTRKWQHKRKLPLGITFDRVSLLQYAQAWDLRIDLKRRLQFPDVIHTTLKPDAVLKEVWMLLRPGAGL